MYLLLEGYLLDFLFFCQAIYFSYTLVAFKKTNNGYLTSERKLNPKIPICFLHISMRQRPKPLELMVGT